ncbi:hypothetical protein MPSEU_000839400 [Mayamaea pseudoterrestris]|nr:hypothetical protein MPSEU_000839400 [Mayamaea pseudoterrestris]
MLLETMSEDSHRALPERRAHHILPSKTNLKNKRKTTCLPHETVEYLKAWMMSPAHIAHPYPTEQEKVEIMTDTGIKLKQLTNWFVNNRKRFWKPQVEAQMLVVQDVPKATKTMVKTKDEVKMAEPVSPTLCGMVGKVPSCFFPNKRSVSLVSLVDEPPLPPVVSPPRNTVSEHSTSCISSDDESISSDETEELRFADTKMDTVIVYILRPQLGGKPTIDDVATDLDQDAVENVLEQFEYVPKTSSGEASHQAELDRIKLHFLQKYIASVATAVEESTMIANKRTRSFDDMEAVVDTPRPKYRRVSIDMWKEACKLARDGYDSSLPSLEEAANLFGFAKPLSSSQV